MEHEVVVQLPAAAVRQALQDRDLLVRCVPGLSTDAASAGAAGRPTEGRLKLRVGASTITFKGSLSLIEGREGVLTALAEGQEARGSGEAEATLRISVRERPEGCALAFTGDLSADGRLAEFDAKALEAAGRRLLDRFAAALATESGAPEAAAPEEPAPASDEAAAAEPQADEAAAAEPQADEAQAAGTVEPVVVSGTEAATEAVAAGEAADDEESSPDEAAAEATPETADETAEPENTNGDTEGDEDGEDDEDDEDGPGANVVYLEDHAVPDLDDDLSDLIAFTDDEPLPSPEPDSAASFEYQPDPALSGPVRRSIVGRSAEEVDHAPPHGRYAPTPPSRSARARAASRWGGAEPKLLTGGTGDRSAVPWMIGGGVALLGGAVVLVRALRRR
jgi:carbon monoxide dehydrogenase subunit G